MFKFLNPFEKFKKCLNKNNLEDAVALIIANSSIAKNPYFIHCCAHSKNLEIIKLGLSLKPNYITPDSEKHNPLHFLASLTEFNIEQGYSALFSYTPDDYLNKNRQTKNMSRKIVFKNSFDPKSLKLLDPKKKYIHEVTPDIVQMAPIDVSFNNFDVEGIKSFLDYGTSLTKLIKKKMKFYKSMIKESWTGESMNLEKSIVKLDDQYYYNKLFQNFEDVDLKSKIFNKIRIIASLMKKKGHKFNEKKLINYYKQLDAYEDFGDEHKSNLKVFKSLIK